MSEQADGPEPSAPVDSTSTMPSAPAGRSFGAGPDGELAPLEDILARLPGGTITSREGLQLLQAVRQGVVSRERLDELRPGWYETEVASWSKLGRDAQAAARRDWGSESRRAIQRDLRQSRAALDRIDTRPFANRGQPPGVDQGPSSDQRQLEALEQLQAGIADVVQALKTSGTQIEALVVLAGEAATREEDLADQTISLTAWTRNIGYLTVVLAVIGVVSLIRDVWPIARDAINHLVGTTIP